MDEPFRPLSEFIAEVDARGVKEFGWLRWNMLRLVGKVRVRWWFFWHGHKPLTVSREAFDAVDQETRDALRARANPSLDD